MLFGAVSYRPAIRLKMFRRTSKAPKDFGLAGPGAELEAFEKLHKKKFVKISKKKLGAQKTSLSFYLFCTLFVVAKRILVFFTF